MKTTVFENLSPKLLINGEWLVTNGIGGFACGSICGAPTRKYHALLNAALPAPYGRTIMLNYVADTIVMPNQSETNLSLIRCHENDPIELHCLKEFRLEDGLPCWTYEVDGIILEKTLSLIHRQNSLNISYKVISSQQNAQIKWRPFFHFRTNEQPVNVEIPNESYHIHVKNYQYEIECPNFPLLKMYSDSEAPFVVDAKKMDTVYYELEAKRGYESIGQLTSPGYFLLSLYPGDRISFCVSTEPWNTILALSPREARVTEKIRKRNLLRLAGPSGKSSTTDKLVLAADQFLITPTTRYGDMIRLQALGLEVKTIIAGYPWFTDWGRDTMISLEGLTLVTGRSREAYSILLTFAHYIQDGLIPNMFPDGDIKGIYNTADASLWFFQAINRYITMTQDEEILEFLLPKLREIINSHINGTQFGIRMDSDGLLIQGQEGVQLTWMDAKVGDWVVTPRRGKAVEINALWYNALKLFETWTKSSLDIAQQCYESFNQKFWFEGGNYLYDVIDEKEGKDPALRPNQLFAISLTHPVLKEDRWKPVLDAVTRDLLTPFGLRTLSPSHPDYKSTYDGDLRSRDAAYHQGTVWPWLIGPFIDVWLKVYPNDFEQAHEFLKELIEHLNNNPSGTIGEIFDACSPYYGRGCFAQAWSVAELLRCLAKILPHLKIQI